MRSPGLLGVKQNYKDQGSKTKPKSKGLGSNPWLSERLLKLQTCLYFRVAFGGVFETHSGGSVSGT